MAKEASKSKSEKMVEKNQVKPKDISKNLMLRDTTLEIAPNNLSQLFKNFKVDNMTVGDICFQLVYLSALETGFAEANVYTHCARDLWSSYVMTSYFIPKNVHHLTHFKPKMATSDHGSYSMYLRSIADEGNVESLGINKELLSALLTAIITGEFFIVTLRPLTSGEHQTACARSVCLSVPRYVISTITKQKKKAINECLLNMDEFTRKLRDELFVPLRSFHCTLLELDIYPALLGLPLETYHVIFKFLNDHHVQSLAKVSSQFTEFLGKDAFDRSSSSIPTPGLPGNLSSYFEVEPYYNAS